MNTIRLHGTLAEEFGRTFKMDVSSAREAFFALCSQLEGFEQRVREGAFRVVRRKNNYRIGLDETTLDLRAINCTIEIYPAVIGAKGGVFKVIIGVAIIGLAIALAPVTGGGSLVAALSSGIGFLGITYGGIALFGAMLAFGGLAMMFAPSPKANKVSASAAAEDSSFVVNGPQNTMLQGVAVQLVYGETITGSIVVSSEVTIAQLIVAGGSYTASTAWADSGFGSWPASANTLSDVAKVNN
jgi:predicted phage tail protein